MIRKLVLVLAIFLAACGAKQSVDKATAAVAVFHSQLANANYEMIWNSSDDAMRQSGPKTDFVKFLTAVHTKLGNAKSTKQAGWRVNDTTSGDFVILQEDTAFEKGTGTEVFTFIERGDQLKLVGYQINSRDMMLN